ncbi:MAG: tetratricopeptide repeat protein [Myxococcales bacterium]|nr:tetratricopeptide repeat protein [Myxococcales bacterium]
MSQFERESRHVDDGDQLKQKVLDSALDDVPPPDGRKRVLSALNLVSPSARATTRPSPRGGVGGRSSHVLHAALALGVAVAVVMTAFNGDEPVATEPRAGAPAPAAPTATTAEEATTEARVEPPPAAVASAAETVAPPTASASSTTSSARAARPPSSASDDSTLGRELARVSAARSALGAGDAEHALKLLDAYDAEFASGTFSVEVSVLRIEALARAGRADEARRLGNEFLAHHPQGVLARRVSTTLRMVAPHESNPAPTPSW